MTPEDHQPPTTPPIDPLTIGELITLPEAAELSGLDYAILRNIARKGRLRAKKYGRFWLTTLASVEEYKNSRHRGSRTDLGK
ncbi:helix-turn-helix domain-containing protein [Candidatus Chlorohelix sp.]|uniref:helix-turn-helix domain-containing protein n=1 Tax=Candidatus Chlorohelix sp. TaxID=3139201 RepID=UPI003020FB61